MRTNVSEAIGDPRSLALLVSLLNTTLRAHGTPASHSGSTAASGGTHPAITVCGDQNVVLAVANPLYEARLRRPIRIDRTSVMSTGGFSRSPGNHAPSAPSATEC